MSMSNNKLIMAKRIHLSLRNYEINVDTPNRRQLLENGLPRTSSENILGRGSYGTVVKAVYKGKQVAVKILKSTSETMVHTMSNEANVLSWSHENIISILKIESTPDYGIVIMERFPGQCLQSILDTIPLPLEHRINVILDILNALAYCHQRNVLHLDIKPQNVLVSFGRTKVKPYKCKLCDFGSSLKLLKDGICPISYPTRGTVRYMSPEALKSELLSSASDIYSLAVTMWQLKTQASPYAAIDCNDAVAYKVVKCNLRPDSKIDSLAGLGLSPQKLRKLSPKKLVLSPFAKKSRNNGANKEGTTRYVEEGPRIRKMARRSIEPSFAHPAKMRISITNDAGQEMDENGHQSDYELEKVFKESAGRTTNRAAAELEYQSLYSTCWDADPAVRLSGHMLKTKLEAIMGNICSKPI